MIDISVEFSSMAQLCLTLQPHGLQHASPCLNRHVYTYIYIYVYMYTHMCNTKGVYKSEGNIDLCSTLLMSK